jgi:hypothetical protein
MRKTRSTKWEVAYISMWRKQSESSRENNKERSIKAVGSRQQQSRSRRIRTRAWDK